MTARPVQGLLQVVFSRFVRVRRIIQPEDLALNAEQFGHAPALFIPFDAFERFVDRPVCFGKLPSGSQPLGQRTEGYRVTKGEACLAEPVQGGSQVLKSGEDSSEKLDASLIAGA